MKFQKKNGLYPIIALLSTVLIFFSGLLLVDSTIVYFYLLLLISIFILFGYGKIIFLVLIMFMPIASLSAGMALSFGSKEQALQTGLRMLILGMSATPTCVMQPIDLVRNMNQVGLPKWLSLGTLISIKFTTLIRQEMKQIQMAMKVRGMSATWYHPQVWYRGLIIPFIIRLMSISDLLTVSLETRAYSIKEKNTTVYKIVSVKAMDIIYSICICSIIGLCFYLK